MEKWIFRGYDIIGNKGWVYGDLTHNQKVTRTGLEPRTMVGGYEVDLESVGLCTGLKDKNGKDVYEGDIVLNSWCFEDKSVVKFGKYQHLNAQREYANGDFGFFLYHLDDFKRKVERNDILFFFCNEEKGEVIGNIYERNHPKKEDNTILDKKLVDCELSVRALGVCKWNGIETLRGLTQISKVDFYKLRNCGKTTLEEVDDLLQKYNLNWKPTL